MIGSVGPAYAISMSAVRDLIGTVVAISVDLVLIMLAIDRGSASAVVISVLTAETITTVAPTVIATRFAATANVLLDPIWTAERPTLRITV